MVHLHSEKKHEKSGCFGTFYHISVIIKPILNAFFERFARFALVWEWSNGPAWWSGCRRLHSVETLAQHLGVEKPGGFTIFLDEAGNQSWKPAEISLRPMAFSGRVIR